MPQPTRARPDADEPLGAPDGDGREQDGGDGSDAPGPGDPSGQGEPGHGPGAAQAVLTAALRRWHAELSGLDGPSPLSGPGGADGEGTLDLSHAHPSGAASFLAGRPTRLSHLFRESAALDHARDRARTIRLTAHALADEHGLRACVLAVGSASWRGSAGGAVSTPVLLRPIELRPRGAGDYELDLGGPVRTNPALVRELARRGVRVDPGELAALSQRQQGFDPTPSLERLRAITRADAPSVEVRAGLVVTALVDVAPALVAELERVAPHLLAAEPEALLALAGDPRARHRLAGAALRRGGSASAPPLDRVRVLALDPDQRRVVSAALAGTSLRVAAGPGTGATQVAAATVAALVGAGRRVLVVPGQQAEAAGLAQRLAPAGLAHLLDGGPLTPWPAGRGDGRGDAGSGATDATAAAELAAGAAALAQVRQPWGVSVADAHAALAHLDRRVPAPSTTAVLSPAALAELPVRERDQVSDLLVEAASLGVLSRAAGATSWWGADLSEASDAEAALSTVVELRSQLLPDLRSHVRVMARATGLREPGSVARAAELLRLVVAVRSTLDVFTPHVYERPVTDLVEATAPAAQRAASGAPRLGLLARRRAERAAAELLRPGSAPADLHAALAAADASRRTWLSWQLGETAGALPVVPRGLPQTEVLCQAAIADLEALAPALATTADGGDLLGASWEALEERLARLEADAATLDSLPRRTVLMVRLRAAGLEPLLEDLRAREVPTSEVAAELQRCWWLSLLAAARQDSPVLASTLERRAALLGAAARAEREGLRAAARTVAAAGASVREQGGALQRCRVSAPLALPHEVGPGERFDAVVVLGAHRVGVPEAVLAMARAEQVVVLGDPRGLGVADLALPEGADAGPGSARTSLLEAVEGALPTVVLGTQHRMPAALAALAGAAGAEVGAPCLPTAPWAAGTGLSLVRSGAGSGAGSGATTGRVVDLLVHHARSRPQESLAVVATTRALARGVADAVREAYRDRPELREFLGRTAGPHEERFVITDAARSGDTVRDAVVVVADDPADDGGGPGGPGGQDGHGGGDGGGHGGGDGGGDGGERRLAVALTRARRHVTLVVGEDVADRTGALARLVAHLRASAAPTPAPAGPTDPLLARVVAECGDVVATVPDGPVDLVLTRRGGAAGQAASRGVVVLTDPDGASEDTGGVRGRDGRRSGAGGPAVGDAAASDDADRLAALVQREVALPAELVAAGWRPLQVGAAETFADPAAVARRVRGVLGSA